MIVISDDKRKARKRHVCNFCGGFIEVGEIYSIQTIKDDDIYVWKSHGICNKFALDNQDLLLAEDNMITKNSFCELVYDKVSEIYDEDADDITDNNTIFEMIKMIELNKEDK
jgi:hypothetical protein